MNHLRELLKANLSKLIISEIDRRGYGYKAIPDATKILERWTEYQIKLIVEVLDELKMAGYLTLPSEQFAIHGQGEAEARRRFREAGGAVKKQHVKKSMKRTVQENRDVKK